MTRDREIQADWDCVKASCPRSGAFWLYDGEADYWSPVCEIHAEHAHPSIELHAWLESGYMKPIELGRPEDPPDEPTDRRARLFRDEIETVVDWTGPD